jgi:cytochrome b
MKQARPNIVVWDPSLRLFHWTLGIAFATAFVVGDGRVHLHVLAGGIVAGLLLYRLLWGWIGPHHALFSDFVRRPGEVGRHLRELVRGRAERHLGHTPAGGAMILLLMAMLALLVITGLLLDGAELMSGPLAALPRLGDGVALAWLADVHGMLADAVVVMVILHVAGVLLESLLHRENLVLSMVTGRKRPEPKEE